MGVTLEFFNACLGVCLILSISIKFETFFAQEIFLTFIMITFDLLQTPKDALLFVCSCSY